MLKTPKTNKSIKGILRLALLGLTLLLAACEQAKIAPVNINPEDMCSMCRMAISEKQFAAEFITKDGDAFKFDDIGCMSDYLKAQADRSQITAFFVADYESKTWLRAEPAPFVKSDEFATPMGGHLAAFQTEERAKEAATKFKGQKLGFVDVFGK